MKTFFRWLGAIMLGAVVGGVLGFVGFWIRRTLNPAEAPIRMSDDWDLILGTACCWLVGAGLGAIYGTARLFNAPLLKVLRFALWGALIGGGLPAGTFLCARAISPAFAANPGNQLNEVAPLGAMGALFGFAVGSAAGIAAAREKVA
jgi:hypothetical protein